MDVQTAIEHRHSVRRFLPEDVSTATLYRLIELSHLYASAANLQPIRYGIVTEESQRRTLFSQLTWAGYLPDFEISPEQQPPAYVILLRDNTVSHSCRFEVGAAATNLMLAATEMGLGTCCLASFSPDQLQQLLHCPTSLFPELVIAVGYTSQVIRTVPFTNTVQYTQDANQILLVPKRNTEDVIVSFRP